MSNRLIVIENKEDWAPYFPSVQVVTVDDYLQNPSQMDRGRAQIINLCHSLDYLSPGYYCSMVSEARGHKVVPSLRTINDLSRKSLYAYDISELAFQLDKLISATNNAEQLGFVVKVFFGHCEIPSLQKLARQIYDQFACPIIEIEFSYKEHWQIRRIGAGAINKLTENEQDSFANALDHFDRKLWRKPSKKRSFRYDMAILHNPDEKIPPSDSTALNNFIKSGRRIGIDVELITPKDYIRLAEYDALFIRETTATNNHTYK
ncbi:MAG: RimK-like ATPgrasp N-terminal domain-containing protein, partial [Gammaproteobacteria bacterium]|nr:RimK-like ATPgrasp N-terminal domain-containing protein [Gammaproteobacteria bacterium]